MCCIIDQFYAAQRRICSIKFIIALTRDTSINEASRIEQFAADVLLAFVTTLYTLRQKRLALHASTYLLLERWILPLEMKRPCARDYKSCDCRTWNEGCLLCDFERFAYRCIRNERDFARLAEVLVIAVKSQLLAPNHFARLKFQTAIVSIRRTVSIRVIYSIRSWSKC